MLETFHMLVETLALDSGCIIPPLVNAPDKGWQLTRSHPTKRIDLK